MSELIRLWSTSLSLNCRGTAPGHTVLQPEHFGAATVHHPAVFGINFQIHSVSLAILVSIHLLIHLSTHLCHHSSPLSSSFRYIISSITPSLFHSSTFSTNPSHLRVDFFYPLDCLMIMGLDRTYHAHIHILSYHIVWPCLFVSFAR